MKNDVFSLKKPLKSTNRAENIDARSLNTVNEQKCIPVKRDDSRITLN